VRVISYDRVQEQLKLSDEQRLRIGELQRQVTQAETDLFADMGLQPNKEEECSTRSLKEESTRQTVAAPAKRSSKNWTRHAKAPQGNLPQAQGANALFRRTSSSPGSRRDAANLSWPAFARRLSAEPPHSNSRNNLPHRTRFTAPDSLAERLKLIRAETERRMIGSVLTTAQQAKLREMRGKNLPAPGPFGSVNAIWASDAATSDSSSSRSSALGRVIRSRLRCFNGLAPALALPRLPRFSRRSHRWRRDLVAVLDARRLATA